MKKILCLLIASIFVACAGPGKVGTPSGLPEVRISADREEVKNRVLDNLHNMGFAIESESASTIVAKQHCTTDKCLSWPPFGFRDRPVRTKVTLFSLGKDTKAVMSLFCVGEQSSGCLGLGGSRELEIPMNRQEDMDAMQRFLNSLK